MLINLYAKIFRDSNENLTLADPLSRHTDFFTVGVARCSFSCESWVADATAENHGKIHDFTNNQYAIELCQNSIECVWFIEVYRDVSLSFDSPFGHVRKFHGYWWCRPINLWSGRQNKPKNSLLNEKQINQYRANRS